MNGLLHILMVHEDVGRMRGPDAAAALTTGPHPTRHGMPWPVALLWFVRAQARVGDDAPPPPEQLQSEKEALRGDNILMVLGSLRAIVKSLWDFKVGGRKGGEGARGTAWHQGRSQGVCVRGEGRMRSCAHGGLLNGNTAVGSCWPCGCRACGHEHAGSQAHVLGL